MADGDGAQEKTLSEEIADAIRQEETHRDRMKVVIGDFLEVERRKAENVRNILNASARSQEGLKDAEKETKEHRDSIRKLLDARKRTTLDSLVEFLPSCAVIQGSLEVVKKSIESRVPECPYTQKDIEEGKIDQATQEQYKDKVLQMPRLQFEADYNTFLLSWRDARSPFEMLYEHAKSENAIALMDDAQRTTARAYYDFLLGILYWLREIVTPLNEIISVNGVDNQGNYVTNVKPLNLFNMNETMALRNLFAAEEGAFTEVASENEDSGDEEDLDSRYNETDIKFSARRRPTGPLDPLPNVPGALPRPTDPYPDNSGEARPTSPRDGSSVSPKDVDGIGFPSEEED